MKIPTQALIVAAASAFRTADFHVRFCETCHVDMRLPEMCEVGQRLALDAVTSLELGQATVSDMVPASVSAEFEQSVREQIRSELLYYADRMETGRPELADVRRDAYYVREAAKVARQGLGRTFFAGCLDEPTTHHMDEISRLRDALDEETTRRAVAEEWADLLAYGIAPPEVIGRRDSDGWKPWGDAYDLSTPAAEVAALRAALVAHQTGQEPPVDLGDAWTAERAAQIRTLVSCLGAGDAYGTRTPMAETVETAAAIEAATVLQLRVDYLEFRVQELELEASTSAPERMTKLRPEFFECASVEAIRDAARRARQNQARWDNRVGTLDGLLQARLAQIKAGTWPTAAEETTPAVDPGECTQNRNGRYVRLTDPIVLGPHFYKADDAGVLRCAWCALPAHWGGEAQPTPTVPAYVHNANSVNRTTGKHLVDPQDPTTTLCPGRIVASKPMPAEEAALLALCGGCRRAVTGQQD